MSTCDYRITVYELGGYIEKEKVLDVKINFKIKYQAIEKKIPVKVIGTPSHMYESYN